MASPLSTLRKYQFAFFVFFGVVCMLVFVIGDPLDTWLRSRSGGNRRSENKVVVRWDGGQLREDEIGYSQSVRNVIREFIRTLITETQKKNGSPRVQMLSLSPSEEDIVYTHLLAQRAEALGMVVSDETALLYLEQLTAQLIPRSAIGQLFKETVGGRITEQQLLGEIKSELLAQNYLSLNYPDLTRGQLPAQAWEYHLRLNRRIKAEVAPVPVEPLISKVTTQPTDDQIAALYNQAKDRYPDPASPEPGFKRQRKAAFEFVRGDRKKFEDEETAKLKPQVTEQEIQEYYDKNKPEFRVPDLPPEPTKPDAAKPDAAKPDAAKPDAAKPDDQKPKVEQPDEKKGDSKPSPENSTEKKAPAPTPESKPSDEKKSDETKAAAPSPDKPADAPQKDAPQKDAPQKDAPQKDAPAKDDTKGESSCEEEPAAEKATDEKAAADKSVEKSVSPAADQPANAPAAAKKENVPQADAVKKETEKKEEGEKKESTKGESPPASPASTPTPTPTPTPDKPADAPPASPVTPTTPPNTEPKYKPLDDKLKEEIREKLARQKAAQATQQRLDKAFEDIKRAVAKYASEKRSAEISQKAAPAPLDTAKLAETHGLTFGSVPLSDPKQIQETELGKTRGFDFSSMSFEPIPFHVLAYRDGIPLWAPDQIRGSAADGNPDAEFLYWKTKEVDPFVPLLKDIRDEVVQAWKLREALALAQTEAKTLAEQATKSGKSLKEAFSDKPEVKVAETNQFTWMTRGFLPANMGGAPSLSSVDNVEYAGDEFMRAVFAFKAGEVGVATNQPKTTVYVVRVESEAPTEEVLRDQFLQSGNSNDLQNVAAMDRMDLRQKWFESLRSEMNVKWERDPQS